MNDTPVGREQLLKASEKKMVGWNGPDVTPDKPGEYRAALDPADASPDVRRRWTGSAWSNPYAD